MPNCQWQGSVRWQQRQNLGGGLSFNARADSSVPPLGPDGFGLDPARPGMHPAGSSGGPWAAACPSMPRLIPRRPDAEVPPHGASPDQCGARGAWLLRLILATFWFEKPPVPLAAIANAQ
jgi:hypothetical protein